MDFAERLSLWLNAFDAIELQSAHHTIRGLHAPTPGAARAGTQGALAQDLQRARAVLARAITQAAPSPQDTARGFAWYRDRHLELQRQMELLIGPLRAHVREVASCRSARLRQLAALDAAMERVLAAREQALMAKLPALLKRRFEQLQAGAAAGDDMDDWPQAFGREWRLALLAELDVRLAPVAGLVEAADDDGNQTP